MNKRKMKNEKSQMIMLLCMMTLLIISCDTGLTDTKSEEPEQSPIETNEKTRMKQFLVDQGFPENLIDEKDDSFLIDGDMKVSFNSIRSFLDGDNSSKEKGKLQASNTFGLVNLHDVDDPVSIGIHPLFLTHPNFTQWHLSLEEAITEWNNVDSNSRIELAEVSSTLNADIILSHYVDPQGAEGIAGLPSGGNPGSYVLVNMNNFVLPGGLPSISNDLQRRKVLIHELGHTLGFRHTNWVSRNESDAAKQIPYTPLTDVNSIMNGPSSVTSFSSHDRRAAQVAYPKTVSRPSVSIVSSSESGSIVNVVVNSSAYFPANNVFFEAKKDNGSWQQAGSFNYPSTNTTLTLPLDGTAGTYYIRARGLSYGGTLFSTYSITQLVSVSAGSGGGGCLPTEPCGGGF